MMLIITIHIHILFLIARVDIIDTLNMTDIQEQSKSSATKNNSWHQVVNTQPLFAWCGLHCLSRLGCLLRHWYERICQVSHAYGSLCIVSKHFESSDAEVKLKYSLASRPHLAFWIQRPKPSCLLCCSFLSLSRTYVLTLQGVQWLLPLVK